MHSNHPHLPFQLCSRRRAHHLLHIAAATGATPRSSPGKLRTRYRAAAAGARCRGVAGTRMDTISCFHKLLPQAASMAGCRRKRTSTAGGRRPACCTRLPAQHAQRTWTPRASWAGARGTAGCCACTAGSSQHLQQGRTGWPWASCRNVDYSSAMSSKTAVSGLGGGRQQGPAAGFGVRAPSADPAPGGSRRRRTQTGAGACAGSG